MYCKIKELQNKEREGIFPPEQQQQEQQQQNIG